MNSDYYGNIRNLLRFLTRDGENGYAFAIARHEGLIPTVNQEILKQARELNKTIWLGWYEDDSDLSFTEQIRQLPKDVDAYILMGHDKPLRENKDFIINFNFAREELNALGKPILFWLNPESLTLVTNQAADLFSQRRISTVQFEEAPEIAAPSPELERRFREEYRSSEDYEKLRNRVNLLKKQLAEATEAGIPRQRIARDIVLPLAETYSELDLHEEALGLLEEYKDVWDEEDARELYKRGGIMGEASKYSEAIDCLEKAKQMIESEKTDLELLGNVCIGLGDTYRVIGTLDKALQNYERNLELRELIFGRNTYLEESKNELGVALNRLGGIYETQGKLVKALEFFEKSLQIREELHATNPLSENLKNNLATSYLCLGRIYEVQGKLVKALEFFEKSLQIREELHATNPLSENLKSNLATSYYFLGRIYKSQGKLAKAIEFFEKYLQLTEELHAANPLSENLKNNLAVAHSWLGTIYTLQDKLNDAMKFFEKSLQIYEKLYASNLLSEHLKKELAKCYPKLGDIYKSQGKLNRALEFFEKYSQIFEELHIANPLSEDLKRELAVSYNKLGGIYESQGRFNQALNFYEKNCSIFEELHTSNPVSENLKMNLANSYGWMAQISARSGKWFKAILYSWKGLGAAWQLCCHVNWARHKMTVLNGFFGLLFTLIFFPPFSIILFWLGEKTDLLYKRFRYGGTDK